MPSPTTIVTHHPPVTRALRVEELRFEPAERWPDSRPVLTVARDALPLIPDPLTRRLVARLALALSEMRDEARALRETLSATLTLTHQQHTQLERLREQIAMLRRPR